jgi:hypothetical protein
MNNIFPLRTTRDAVSVFGIPNDSCNSDICERIVDLVALKHHSLCFQIALQHLFSPQGKFPSINFVWNYEHSSAGESWELSNKYGASCFLKIFLLMETREIPKN